MKLYICPNTFTIGRQELKLGRKQQTRSCLCRSEFFSMSPGMHMWWSWLKVHMSVVRCVTGYFLSISLIRIIHFLSGEENNLNGWHRKFLLIDCTASSNEKMDVYSFGVLLWQPATLEQKWGFSNHATSY